MPVSVGRVLQDSPDGIQREAERHMSEPEHLPTDEQPISRARSRDRSISVSVPRRPVLKRVLEVQHVEITRLSSIDENAGTFSAQIFVRCIFPNGAEDPHLMAYPEGTSLSTPHFPLDAEGKPLWRPNAAWYLQRMIFDNMITPPKEQLLVAALVVVAVAECAAAAAAGRYERVEAAITAID